MSPSAKTLIDLGQGVAYSFSDWPNSAIPAFGAGVYTIWHKDGRFIYVGMSGRGITADTVHRNTPQGIYTRLQSHASERAIEVDHIIPRKHGGADDLTNLQALCFKCNANKGARDDEDFRVIRESINKRQSGCIFCKIPEERIIAFNALAFAIRDKYPVTELHTLIIPKRHAATFFDLFEPERRAINQLLDEMRAEILSKDGSVSGFNIGMNNGSAAGQTVGHAHFHLIPRPPGDVQDPTGGIRGIIPGKAIY